MPRRASAAAARSLPPHQARILIYPMNYPAEINFNVPRDYVHCDCLISLVSLRFLPVAADDIAVSLIIAPWKINLSVRDVSFC